jgi:hypothetical protein
LNGESAELLNSLSPTWAAISCQQLTTPPGSSRFQSVSLIGIHERTPAKIECDFIGGVELLGSPRVSLIPEARAAGEGVVRNQLSRSMCAGIRE